MNAITWVGSWGKELWIICKDNWKCPALEEEVIQWVTVETALDLGWNYQDHLSDLGAHITYLKAYWTLSCKWGVWQQHSLKGAGEREEKMFWVIIWKNLRLLSPCLVALTHLATQKAAAAADEYSTHMPKETSLQFLWFYTSYK